jgi:uncharacterized radical SAM superfamily Fe-S cluster-containing enzyme
MPAAMPEISALLYSKLENLRDKLRGMEEAEAVRYFEVGEYDRLWKSTVSLCPQCLEHIPALIFSSRTKVLMHKVCPMHGLFAAVVENDEKFYRLSNKDQWGRRYALGEKELVFPYFQKKGGPLNSEEYTDQIQNKSCTTLVEITNACNLACPVCYSDAKGNRKLTFARFAEQINKLIEKKGVLDSVQLTGGEAALHEEFWEMIGFLYDKAEVKKIYLPTNGIAFAKEEASARLAPFTSKLMVLLQFDGSAPETNLPLRNANTVRVRETVIENLESIGAHMQLTMTITLGVNDHEIGWVIQKGLRHDHVKVVALQPVTYSGRYELAQDPLKRMTLSDVVKAVVKQLDELAAEADFSPIPCSHPNCGWITLFARRFGLRKNISRQIDLDRVMNQVANRTLLSTPELRNVMGTRPSTPLASAAQWLGKKLIRSTDIFAVAIKPFMDKYNYDQDRISACCHHLLDRKGNPISFCEYNARLRTKDPWDSFPALREKEV